MYTIRHDRPLNRVTLAILKTLHETANRCKANYFVIGATARDILMTHVFGIESGRATRDVDFAVALEDWSQFAAMKQEFVDTGDFSTSPSEAHRLHYRPKEFGQAYPLDLIPFGKIEHAGHLIAWPPDMAVVMNVAGYAEAQTSTIPVDVGDNLIVRVVSIPALAALKLFAWNDRGLSDNKDAQDLYFLLRNYHAAGNDARLYGKAYPFLESCAFDLNLAGARLLGYDLKLILLESTCEQLRALLNDPRKRDRLAIHMDRTASADASVTLKFIEQMDAGLASTIADQ